MELYFGIVTILFAVLLPTIRSQWNSDLQVQESRNRVSETRVKSIQDILLLPDEPPPLPPNYNNERPRIPPNQHYIKYRPPQYRPQEYGSLSNYANGHQKYAPSYSFSQNQGIDDFSNQRQRPFQTQNYLPGNGYEIYEVPDPPDETHQNLYPQNIRHQSRYQQSVQPNIHKTNADIYRTRQQTHPNAPAEIDANSADFLINPLNFQNDQQHFRYQQHSNPSATKVNVYKSRPTTLQAHQISSSRQVDSEINDLSNNPHIHKRLQENVGSSNQKLRAAATNTKQKQTTIITQPEQAVAHAVNVRQQQGNLVLNPQSEKFNQYGAENSNIQGNPAQASSSLSSQQVDEALKVLTHIRLLQAAQQPLPLNPFAALVLAASFKRHPYLRT